MERLEGGPRNKSEAVKCALEKCVGVLLSFLLPRKSLDEVISLQTKGSEDNIPYEVIFILPLTFSSGITNSHWGEKKEHTKCLKTQEFFL